MTAPTPHFPRGGPTVYLHKQVEEEACHKMRSVTNLQRANLCLALVGGM